MSPQKLEQQVLLKIKELYTAFDHYQPSQGLNGALHTGQPGGLLFQLYYLRWLGENDEQVAEKLIEFISEQIQQPIVSLTFCNGISGFAWFLNHLKIQNMLELDEELFIDFDDVIFEGAMADFKDANHDFLHGGLGQIIYLIERCTYRDKCRDYVIELLNELESQAHIKPNGVCWVESEIMLEKESIDNHVVNLHLSHGQAGKIVVLSKMILAGIDEAIPLCRKAVDYLLSLEGVESEDALIPSSIVNHEEEWFSHLGWCRGNISISIALMIAAEALQDKTVKAKATEIGLHTIKLDTPDKARIYDAGMCHGFVGLSHMYKRLYKYSGNVLFEKASSRWMNLVMEAARFEDGIAGFKLIDGLSKKWVLDYGLLTGTAGIGLAMIAHVSDENMDWDGCFLLN